MHLKLAMEIQDFQRIQGIYFFPQRIQELKKKNSPGEKFFPKIYKNISICFIRGTHNSQ